jgi:hypothetical protein
MRGPITSSIRWEQITQAVITGSRQLSTRQRGDQQLHTRGARPFLVVDVLVFTLVTQVLGGWFLSARYAPATRTCQRLLSVKILIRIGRKRIHLLGPASGFLSGGPLLIGPFGLALCDPFECLGPRLPDARFSLQPLSLRPLLSHALRRSLRALFQLSYARKGLLGLYPEPLSFATLPVALCLACFRYCQNEKSDED